MFSRLLFFRYVSIFVCSLIFLASGCATYYQKSLAFHKSFVNGDVEAANRILDKNKKAAQGNDRLLYFTQKGVVLQVMGKYEESNKFFEDAYIYSEDLQKNYALEALSFLSNPAVKPYQGEDFERVMVHYYKAINYLHLNKYEEAQVECRRLNIKLAELNDQYKGRKNRYRSDAFALNLMGIIFEASGEINNAFISYRNAYESYKEDFGPEFGIPVPKQLKLDLLRTAYLNGFSEELSQYENAFSMKYQPEENSGGEAIVLVNNGLGPVKGEWSINFFIVKGQGGVISFVNEEMGLTIPFSSANNGDGAKLGDLKFVRVAFPKYIERKPYYRNPEIIANGKKIRLEMVTNINEIAFKSLEDRMLRELGVTLLRLAAKQAAEKLVSKKSEGLGALLSVVNAVSEKTDTRNWQTLPYSVSYSRVRLPAGQNTLELQASSPRGTRALSRQYQLDIQEGKTTFLSAYILDSIPLDL